MEAFELPIPENPTSAIAVEMPSKLILGKRAERFFEEAITRSSRYELLAQNIQVFEDQQTLGEFDFFIEDQLLNQKLHVELVFKFYLYDSTILSETNRWIGPNRNDFLIRKLDRLRNHQLPLLRNPGAIKMLEVMGLHPERLKQKVCFKANLFVPRSQMNRDFPFINSKCLAGYWIFRKEFSAEEYGDYQFFSPRKRDWPAGPESNSIWKSFESVQHEVEVLLQHHKSALIWMKKNEQHYERFFVVWW